MKKVGEDSLLYIETLSLGVTAKLKKKDEGDSLPGEVFTTFHCSHSCIAQQCKANDNLTYGRLIGKVF